jgi:hypothetical protein
MVRIRRSAVAVTPGLSLVSPFFGLPDSLVCAIASHDMIHEHSKARNRRDGVP